MRQKFRLNFLNEPRYARLETRLTRIYVCYRKDLNNRMRGRAPIIFMYALCLRKFGPHLYIPSSITSLRSPYFLPLVCKFILRPTFCCIYFALLMAPQVLSVPLSISLVHTTLHTKHAQTSNSRSRIIYSRKWY